MSLEAAQASVLAKTRSDRGSSRKSLRPTIDIVTIILAIASIAFAYKQKLDSSDLEKKTAELEINVSDILGATSTGYVANFPHSIPVITKVVQGACTDLDIMIDVPGYGEYSDPQAFYSYMHSILDLRHRSIQDDKNAGYCVGKNLEKDADLTRSPNVRLLLFSPEQRKLAVRKQLTKDVLARSLAEATGRAMFINFFQRNPALLQEPAENFLERVKGGSGYEQFVAILLADFEDQERELKKAGVEMRYTRDPYIMRIWLQDSEAAAFSFDHSNEEEIAFQTRDPKLLNNFKQIFKQQWDAAISYADYWNGKEKTSTARVNGVQKKGA